MPYCGVWLLHWHYYFHWYFRPFIIAHAAFSFAMTWLSALPFHRYFMPRHYHCWPLFSPLLDYFERGYFHYCWRFSLTGWLCGCHCHYPHIAITPLLPSHHTIADNHVIDAIAAIAAVFAAFTYAGCHCRFFIIGQIQHIVAPLLRASHFRHRLSTPLSLRHFATRQLLLKALIFSDHCHIISLFIIFITTPTYP